MIKIITSKITHRAERKPLVTLSALLAAGTLLSACVGGQGQGSSQSTNASQSSSVATSSEASSSSVASSAGGCDDAIARGKTLYDVTHACAACHGDKGQGAAAKAINMNAERYRHSTQPAEHEGFLLPDYIAAYMPQPGNVCTGSCAEDVTAYMRSLVGIEWCPSGEQSSSSVDSTVVPEPTVTFKAKAPRMRRLNRTEYDNTVRDLFGTQLRPARDFLADVRGKDGHYLKDGSVQSVTIDDAERFYAAASTVADDAIARNIAALNCDGQDAACVEGILDNLGTRIWRRPLSDSEKATLLSIYSSAKTLGNDHRASLYHVLRTMLLSPNFMYVLEPNSAGDNRPLTGYELATRLSYFLWSSTPDSELLQLAANGTLQQEATLRQQVRRLLADPRASSLVTEFAHQWLQFAKRRSTPDANLFPGYNEALREAMDQETEAFIQHLISNNAPISELLTANYSFLNGRLKAFYGVNDMPANGNATPVRVQAEDYTFGADLSAGNEGGVYRTDDVDIEATMDTDGGYNLGWTSSGEWVEYALTIATSGPYQLALRTASQDGGGSIAISINGQRVAEDISIPSTGDWQAWQTLVPVDIGALDAGEHTVRISIASGGFNLNWFEVSPGGFGERAFSRYQWSGEPRQGILTHASVLTATSNNLATSPVVRGVWVLETLLCDAPPPPPPDLPITDPDEIADSASISTREKFELHGEPQCRSCHLFVDPIGFGLENYDPIGQWRLEEWRGVEGKGPWPVDATGILPTGESFDGGVALSEILATSYRLPMCFTSHVATYGLGRYVKGLLPGGTQSDDYPLVYDIYKKTEANGHRFQDMIEELVVSDAFRQRGYSAE